MSKIKEVREAYIDSIEELCLEEAKKGNKFLLLGKLSDETEAALRERKYKIGYKYEGVNYGGDTLVGTYISW